MSERIAALVVPGFPVAALVRAEPELRGVPLVVCRTRSRGGSGRVVPHAEVIAVSREAARAGARCGATVAQNMIACADLVVRPADPCAEQSARDALLDAAASISPRLEWVEPVWGRSSTSPRARHADAVLGGIRASRADCAEVLIDVAGTAGHFASENGLLAALAERARRCGFAAGLAVAEGRATARVAGHIAATRLEALVVPRGAGEVAAWLAPHPLDVLRPLLSTQKRDERELWGMLRRLGLERVGDLCRLPRDGLATRLGPAAALLWRIASGEDSSVLCPGRPREVFAEAIRLDYPVDSLETLLLVMGGLLERLCARLETRALTTREINLALGLSDGAALPRRLAAASPTRETRTWMRLLRTLLETDPPPDAVEEIAISAMPERPRAAQLDFFQRTGALPAALDDVLARVATFCGERGLGRPTPPLDHRPESWRLLPFVAGGGQGAGGRRSAEPLGSGPAEDQRHAAAAEAALEIPSALARPLGLRVCRPPSAVEVGLDRGEPAWVRAEGFGGRVVIASGPWRLDTAWWSDEPCRRDYYDVQLSDGGIYRLFEERARGGWFVDGIYD